MLTHNMALIPQGSFLMGGIGECADAENPRHEVNLSSFWMDKTPVTNCQFSDFIERSGYVTECERLARPRTWKHFSFEGRDSHPVVMVTWMDATEYAKFMGKRLPTEAEWEKSSRGGLFDCLYPWGSEEPTPAVAFWGRAEAGLVVPATAEVGSLPANSFGLHDMVGNVWQWCSDWYGEEYYRDSPNVNPAGPETGQAKVRRGGAWNVRESFRLRCSNRGAMMPDQAWPNLGFRCAKTA